MNTCTFGSRPTGASSDSSRSGASLPGKKYDKMPSNTLDFKGIVDPCDNRYRALVRRNVEYATYLESIGDIDASEHCWERVLSALPRSFKIACKEARIDGEARIVPFAPLISGTYTHLEKEACCRLFDAVLLDWFRQHRCSNLEKDEGKIRKTANALLVEAGITVSMEQTLKNFWEGKNPCQGFNTKDHACIICWAPDRRPFFEEKFDGKSNSHQKDKTKHGGAYDKDGYRKVNPSESSSDFKTRCKNGLESSCKLCHGLDPPLRAWDCTACRKTCKENCRSCTICLEEDVFIEPMWLVVWRMEAEKALDRIADARDQELIKVICEVKDAHDRKDSFWARAKARGKHIFRRRSSVDSPVSNVPEMAGKNTDNHSPTQPASMRERFRQTFSLPTSEDNVGSVSSGRRKIYDANTAKPTPAASPAKPSPRFGETSEWDASKSARPIVPRQLSLDTMSPSAGSPLLDRATRRQRPAGITLGGFEPRSAPAAAPGIVLGGFVPREAPIAGAASLEESVEAISPLALAKADTDDAV